MSKKGNKTGPWSPERLQVWKDKRWPKKAPKTNDSDCEKAIPEVPQVPTSGETAA